MRRRSPGTSPSAGEPSSAAVTVIVCAPPPSVTLAGSRPSSIPVDAFDARTGANPDENRSLAAEVRANPEKMLANMNAAVAYL